jgi:nitrite reductase/ring-hydroxylating ferredoxin subunit
MSDRTWIPALPLAELPVGEARVVRHDGERIALFRPTEGELFAVDNRCPHEGYPLARGSVRDCVVTCPWHNYKFDLRDGRCVMGDEEVRVFPIRLAGDTVEIDVTAPDPASLRPRHLASLEAAIQDNKLGQAARELVRLIVLDTDLLTLTLEILRIDATYAEYGTTHATPTAIDGLRLCRRFSGAEAAKALLQGCSVAAEANQRLPRRGVAEPLDPATLGDDPDAAGERLRALVEAERLHDAEALLRGAIARGWELATIERWFLRLSGDHQLGFGHPLIYTTKLFPVLELADRRYADAILPALLARVVYSTRAELVPEEAWFRDVVAAARPQYASWYAACDRDRLPAIDRTALVDALLDQPRDAWVALLRRSLTTGIDLQSVADALVVAASERILRFDPAIDADPTVQEGWLDVTHRLTFAAAVRAAIGRLREPAIFDLILQAAHFVRSAAPLDLPPAARLVVPDAPAKDFGDLRPALEELTAALLRHDAAAAVDIAARTLALDGQSSGPALVAVAELLTALALGDRAIRPIFAAHWIKTSVVAEDEARALPADVDWRRPLLACVRFFAGPIQERSLQALVHDATRFVVDGKVPKTLT